jgi:hypothetical protein
MSRAEACSTLGVFPLMEWLQGIAHTSWVPCPSENSVPGHGWGWARNDPLVLLVGKSVRSLLLVLNEAARNRYGHSTCLQ